MRSAIAGVLFLITTVRALTESAEEAQAILEECQRENNVTEDLQNFSYEDFDKAKKCVLSCIFQKQGVLKDDGTFDFDAPKQAIEANGQMSNEMKENVLKVYDKCLDEVKSDQEDVCETAYQFVVCEEIKFKELS